MADERRATRREARRRRILENSEDRLQRITGRHERINHEIPAFTEISAAPENETEHKNVTNGIAKCVQDDNSSSSSFESAASRYADEILSRTKSRSPVTVSFAESNFCTITNNVAEVKPEIRKITEQPDIRINSLLSSNFHFACLGVMTRMLYEFDFSFLFGEMMFLPAFLVLLTEMLFLRPRHENNMNSMMKTILLLGGISPRWLAFLSSAMNFASHIFTALAVYMFAFTITDCFEI